jgi:hypothetical protein
MSDPILPRQPDEEVPDYRPPYGGNHYGSVGNPDNGFRKLVDSLLVIGIAGLIAVVWNLSNSVAILTTQVMYQREEIQAQNIQIQQLQARLVK